MQEELEEVNIERYLQVLGIAIVISIAIDIISIAICIAVDIVVEVAIVIVFSKLPRDHTCCPVTCCRCCCQPFIEVNQSGTGVEVAAVSRNAPDVTAQLTGHNSLHPPSYADIVQAPSAPVRPVKSFHS